MCKQPRHACLRCSCLKHACLDLLCKRALIVHYFKYCIFGKGDLVNSIDSRYFLRREYIPSITVKNNFNIKNAFPVSNKVVSLVTSHQEGFYFCMVILKPHHSVNRGLGLNKSLRCTYFKNTFQRGLYSSTCKFNRYP